MPHINRHWQLYAAVLTTAKNIMFVVNWSVEQEHLEVLNLVVKPEEAVVVDSIFLLFACYIV